MSVQLAMAMATFHPHASVSLFPILLDLRQALRHAHCVARRVDADARTDADAYTDADARTSFRCILALIDNDDAMQRRPYAARNLLTMRWRELNERVQTQAVAKRAPGTLFAPVAIIRAAKRGLADTVRMLLDVPSVDPTVGRNAALIAATQRKRYAVLELLANDPRVGTRLSEVNDVYVALQIALARKDEHAVALLLPLTLRRHRAWRVSAPWTQLALLTAGTGHARNTQQLIECARKIIVGAQEEDFKRWRSRTLMHAIGHGRSSDVAALDTSHDMLQHAMVACDRNVQAETTESAINRGDVAVVRRLTQLMRARPIALNTFDMQRNQRLLVCILRMRASDPVIVELFSNVIAAMLANYNVFAVCLSAFKHVVYHVPREQYSAPALVHLFIKYFGDATNDIRISMLKTFVVAGNTACVQLFAQHQPLTFRLFVLHHKVMYGDVCRAGDANMLLALADAVWETTKTADVHNNDNNNIMHCNHLFVRSVLLELLKAYNGTSDVRLLRAFLAHHIVHRFLRCGCTYYDSLKNTVLSEFLRSANARTAGFLMPTLILAARAFRFDYYCINNAFIQACSQCNVVAARAMLELGGDAVDPSALGNFALHTVCKDNGYGPEENSPHDRLDRLAIVRLIVDDARTDLNRDGDYAADMHVHQAWPLFDRTGTLVDILRDLKTNK